MSGQERDSERRKRRTERARKGRLAVKAKYGRGYFAEIGRLGGRPTWQEALAKAKANEGGRR